MGFLFVTTIIFCLPYLIIILSPQRRRVYYFHVTTATTAAWLHRPRLGRVGALELHLEQGRDVDAEQGHAH